MEVVGLIVNIKDLVKEAVVFCQSVASAHEDATRLSAELEALQGNIGALHDLLDANTFNPNPIAFNDTSVLVSCSSACEARLRALIARLKHAVDSRLRLLIWPFRKEEFKEMVGELRNFSHWMHFAITIEGCKLLSHSPDHVNRILSEQMNQFQALRSIIDGQQVSIDHITDMMKTEQEEKQMKNVLDWISTFDYETSYRKAISLRVEGTGDWFLKEVISWDNDCSATAIIWCEGKVGSGKTVLSAHAIQNMSQSKSGTLVAYFLFNNKERDLQTPHVLWSSILRQIVAQLPALPDEVKNMYSVSSKRVDGLTPRECDTLLSIVLSSHCSKFIVLDALDEYDFERHGTPLTQFIKRLQQGYNTKAILTSRYPCPMPGVNSLQIEATNGDIRIYIQKQLSDHDITDQKLIRRLLLNIVDQARGMFLLPVFQLHKVLRQPTLGDMEDALDALPTTLWQIYDETITRIERSDPGNARIGLDTLMWIAQAQTPLTLTELCEALSVKKGQRLLDIRFQPSPDRILQCCQGLVTIDMDADSVALVHYSTYEYMESRCGTLFADSQSRMATVCLKYLLYDDFKNGPCRDIHDVSSTTERPRADIKAIKTRVKEYPFVSYAARFWHIHARKAATDSKVSQLVRDYLNDISKIASAAQIQRFTRKYRSSYMTCDELMSHLPLHTVSRLGFLNIVEEILSRNEGLVNINARTARLGSTPIIYAASHGQAEVVKILLRHNADPHISNWYGNALNCAAEAGHSTIIEILIKEASMDPNEPGTRYGSSSLLAKLPVTCTLDRDKLEACETLVKLGAQLSSLSSGSTILHEAVDYGAVRICKWLLSSQSMDLNCKDAHGMTPLHIAVHNRHVEMIDLLTGMGADISIKDDAGFTPFYYFENVEMPE